MLDIDPIKPVGYSIWGIPDTIIPSILGLFSFVGEVCGLAFVHEFVACFDVSIVVGRVRRFGSQNWEGHGSIYVVSLWKTET